MLFSGKNNSSIENQKTEKNELARTTSTPVVVNKYQSTYQKLTNALSAKMHRSIHCLNSLTNAVISLPEVAKSSHPVQLMLKKGKAFFFKTNPAGSLMSELEACAWSFYHINSPQRVPAKAYAIFNSSGEYVGIGVQEIPGFRSIIDDQFTVNDLPNKDIVKGLANILALSYLFQEDDLHRGNMSKYGFRFDFDMSVWPVLGYFKKGTTLDWIYRTRDPKRFVITARDIDNFPDLVDATPFYWCTVPQKGVDERVYRLTKNAFDTTENAAFKQLKSDPVFIREKFKTMLKFLLISTDHYNMLSRQHIRNDLRHSDPEMKGMKITDIMTANIDARKKELRDVLVQMPTFREFLWRHGNEVLKEIKHEFKDYNMQITINESRKWDKYPDRSASILIERMVHLQDVKDTYNDIFREAKEYALAAPVARI